MEVKPIRDPAQTIPAFQGWRAPAEIYIHQSRNNPPPSFQGTYKNMAGKTVEFFMGLVSGLAIGGIVYMWWIGE